MPINEANMVATADSEVVTFDRTSNTCYGETMAIDWKKELSLLGRGYWWYMKAGLISVPFGIAYGCINLYLGHESKAAFVVIIAAALITTFKIQGMMPPRE